MYTYEQNTYETKKFLKVKKKKAYCITSATNFFFALKKITRFRLSDAVVAVCGEQSFDRSVTGDGKKKKKNHK